MRDPTPQALLADTHWLKALLRQFVRDRDLVEDLYQETLVAALQHPAKAERPWIARVARNLALSFLRRESRQRRLRSGLPLPTIAAAATVDLVATAELQQGAVRALLNLDEPYRTTLLLRFMQGLSVRQIADQIGDPIETIRTRQKRGIALLRVKLDARPGRRLALVLPLVVPNWPVPTTTTLWSLVLLKTKLGLASAATLLIMVALAATWIQSSTPREPDAAAPPTTSALAEQPPPTLPSHTQEDVENRRRLVATELDAPVSEIDETATLVVQVRWESDSQPAAGVGIRLHTAARRIPRMTVTGENGIARVEGLKPGRYRLALARSFTREIRLTVGEEQHLEWSLAAGRDVHGQVVDARGQPVAGAEVICTSGGVRPQWSQTLTRTDQLGRFFLRGMHRYNLLGARATGQATSDFLLVTTTKRRADGSAEMRLTIPGPEAVLRGTVLRPDGQPAANAWVKIGRDGQRVDGARRTSPPLWHLRTGVRGEFVVQNLQPGQVPVRVYADGSPPWTGTVACTGHHTTEVTIRIAQGGTVFGKVVDARGYPIAGVEIEVKDAANSSTRSNELGDYRLDHLAAGDTTLVMEKPGAGRGEAHVLVTEGASSRHKLTLDAGLVIRGQLVDERQMPLAGWHVSGMPGRRYPTDREGRFCLPNCEPRAYRIAFFSKLGFTPAIQNHGGIKPGQPERIFRILDADLPSVEIHARVFDASGLPLGAASVDLEQLPVGFLVTVKNSDAKGYVATRRLPPGRYRLRISHPNHESWRSPVLELRAGHHLDLGNVRLK